MPASIMANPRIVRIIPTIYTKNPSIGEYKHDISMRLIIIIISNVPTIS